MASIWQGKAATERMVWHDPALSWCVDNVHVYGYPFFPFTSISYGDFMDIHDGNGCPSGVSIMNMDTHLGYLSPVLPLRLGSGIGVSIMHTDSDHGYPRWRSMLNTKKNEYLRNTTTSMMDIHHQMDHVDDYPRWISHDNSTLGGWIRKPSSNGAHPGPRDLLTLRLSWKGAWIPAVWPASQLNLEVCLTRTMSTCLGSCLGCGLWIVYEGLLLVKYVYRNSRL